MEDIKNYNLLMCVEAIKDSKKIATYLVLHPAIAFPEDWEKAKLVGLDKKFDFERYARNRITSLNNHETKEGEPMWPEGTSLYISPVEFEVTPDIVHIE